MGPPFVASAKARVEGLYSEAKEMAVLHAVKTWYLIREDLGFHDMTCHGGLAL